MKAIIPKILIISIFCFFFSCNSNRKSPEPLSTIEGIVIDKTTNQPAKDFPVSISFIDGEEGVGLNLGSYEIERTLTGNDGTFKFEIFREHAHSYKDVFRISSIGNANYFEIDSYEMNALDLDNNPRQYIIPDSFETYQKISGTYKIVPSDDLDEEDIMIIEFESPNPRYSLYMRTTDVDLTATYPFLRNYPITYRYKIFKDGVLYPEKIDTFIFRAETDTLFVKF